MCLFFKRFTCLVLSLSVGSCLQAFRVLTWNVTNGLGEVSSSEFQEVQRVLLRIEADIVALQEVLRSEEESLSLLSERLGLPYMHVTNTGSFDSSNALVVLSRFPILYEKTVTSPIGARDLTRDQALIEIDLPDTDQPLLLMNLHLKCCGLDPDLFRRAVELKRAATALEAAMGEDSLAVVLGDLNLIAAERTFVSPPSSLPGSFRLGSDISLPLTHFRTPEPFFETLEMSVLEASHQDRNRRNTFVFGNSVLDFILASPALRERRRIRTEVFRIERDARGLGLPKSGRPLRASELVRSYDHYPVYADLTPVRGLPVALQGDRVREGETLGGSVDVSRLAGGSLVTLESSLAGGLTITPRTAIVAANQNTLPFEVEASADAILDELQSVFVSARSEQRASPRLYFEVADRDLPALPLRSLERAATTDFSGFQGQVEPAGWSSTGASWTGSDKDELRRPGFRSYSTSPGVASSEPASLALTLQNHSGITLTALDLSYRAQLHSPTEGDARWEVSFQVDEKLALPELTFRPSSPDGQATRVLKTRIENISLLPGAEAQLHFQYVPASPVPDPKVAFINEFHYDNSGKDVDEFVELIFLRGFSSELSDSQLILYNGSDGDPYRTIPLSAYGAPTLLPGGLGILNVPLSSLQNGSPDGIALVHRGEVLEFLSYEGPLVAASGPAEGLKANELPISQNGDSQPGLTALARTGSGSRGEEFTWELLTSASPGRVNPGQSLELLFQEPVGLSISDVKITPLLDLDRDGFTDRDLDPDLDGQTNLLEFLAGTEPYDPSSFFRLRSAADSIEFPTVKGRQYRVEKSSDLKTWIQVSVIPGDDRLRTFNILGHPPRTFFRVSPIIP